MRSIYHTFRPLLWGSTQLLTCRKANYKTKTWFLWSFVKRIFFSYPKCLSTRLPPQCQLGSVIPLPSWAPSAPCGLTPSADATLPPPCCCHLLGITRSSSFSGKLAGNSVFFLFLTSVILLGDCNMNVDESSNTRVFWDFDFFTFPVMFLSILPQWSTTSYIIASTKSITSAIFHIQMLYSDCRY